MRLGISIDLDWQRMTDRIADWNPSCRLRVSFALLESLELAILPNELLHLLSRGLDNALFRLDWGSGFGRVDRDGHGQGVVYRGRDVR